MKSQAILGTSLMGAPFHSFCSSIQPAWLCRSAYVTVVTFCIYFLQVCLDFEMYVFLCGKEWVRPSSPIDAAYDLVAALLSSDYTLYSYQKITYIHIVLRKRKIFLCCSIMLDKHGIFHQIFLLIYLYMEYYMRGFYPVLSMFHLFVMEAFNFAAMKVQCRNYSIR